MHFNFITRGPKHRVDNFINQLQGVYLPWTVTKDGIAGFKKGDYRVQMRVCPVQFWDISFPKEYQDMVLNTLIPGDGKPMNSKYQKFISVLRMGMKLNKIPEFKRDKIFPVSSALQHTELIAIGIKPDRHEHGTEML